MQSHHKPEWSALLKQAQSEFSRGDFGRAEKLYESAIESANHAFGDRSSHKAIILSELAECFDAQGKENQAEECYRELRDILQSQHYAMLLKLGQ
jgi:tetratricopeptide (TPR) repeat protein